MDKLTSSDERVPGWAVELGRSVNKVENGVEKLTVEQQALVCDLALLSTEVRELRKIIVGNGDPGIKGRLQMIEQWAENQKKVQWVVIGVVVAEVTLGILYAAARASMVP